MINLSIDKLSIRYLFKVSRSLFKQFIRPINSILRVRVSPIDSWDVTVWKSRHIVDTHLPCTCMSYMNEIDEPLPIQSIIIRWFCCVSLFWWVQQMFMIRHSRKCCYWVRGVIGALSTKSLQAKCAILFKRFVIYRSKRAGFISAMDI